MLIMILVIAGLSISIAILIKILTLVRVSYQRDIMFYESVLEKLITELNS